MTKKKSVGIEYVSGISFQNKTFSRQKLFALNRQKKAVNYCYKQYLAEKGSICYLTIEEDEAFTVYREDKTLRIVGVKDPVEILSSLDLNDLQTKLLDLSQIENSDRQYSQYDSQARNDLTTALTNSLQKARDLSQQIVILS